MDYYIALNKNHYLDEKTQALVDDYVKNSASVKENIRKRLERDALSEISWLKFKEKESASYLRCVRKKLVKAVTQWL